MKISLRPAPEADTTDNPNSFVWFEAEGCRWPGLLLDEVAHIGSMQPQAKGTTHNRHSLEGHLLSVSVDPDAWRRIARLGAAPTWLMRPSFEDAPSLLTVDGQDGAPAALFLDMRRLSDEQRLQCAQWAVEQGLLRPAMFGEVSWFDEELDQRVAYNFDLTDPKGCEAFDEELGSRKEDGWDDVRAQRVEGHAPTEALHERIGFNVHAAHAAEMAAILYAQEVLRQHAPALVGAWWDDELDTSRLSAPRGGVFPECVCLFRAQTLGERIRELERAEGAEVHFRRPRG